MQTDGLAFVFINFEQAAGFGHVGWGFQLDSDTYYYGSTDHLWNLKYPQWYLPELIRYMDVQPSVNNDYWAESGSLEDMLQCMRSGPHVRYHAYKCFTVESARAEHARQIADSMKDNGWNVLRNNCVHQSYQILSAYGGKILPCPYKLINRLPQRWFSLVPGEAVEIARHKRKPLPIVYSDFSRAIRIRRAQSEPTDSAVA